MHSRGTETWIVSVTALSLVACNSSSQGFIADDAGPAPAQLYIVHPGHMRSNVKPDIEMNLRVVVDASDKVTQTAMESGVELLDNTKKTKVAGSFKWTHNASGSPMYLDFVPNKPMPEGEYRLSIQKSTLYVAHDDMRVSLFRVGSLPVVYKVTFWRDNINKKTVNVSVDFSEIVQDPTANVSLQIDGKPVTPISARLVPPGGTFTMYLAETSFAKTYRLQVLGSTKSTTGVYLDGKLTGVKTAGGSDFVLEVVPSSLSKAGIWEAKPAS